MLVLNDSQAMIIESLLTKMLINDTYSMNQLEEALGWFQRDGTRVSCPFEQAWSKNLAEEIVRLVQQQNA
jgi:hypothetical protein